MDTILIVLICIIIVIFLLVQLGKRSSTASRRKKAPDFRTAPPPPEVAESSSPAYPLARRMLQALPKTYRQAVKQRVMLGHPDLSEREYDWRWLELQRFFIMCAVLERVPMFSAAVDEVWHEMLMYTRDYQTFSEKYLGRMLHHTPNASESVPVPNERAWFDLVYVELFGWSRYSEMLWGPFFRHPIPRRELEAYRRVDSSALTGERFNGWTFEHLAEARSAIQALRGSLQTRVQMAETREELDERKYGKLNYGSPDVLLTSAIFFAWNDPENFSEHMMPQEQLKHGGSSVSGCYSGSGCSGGDSHHRHHDGGDSGHHSHHGSDGGSHSGSDSGGGSSCSSSSCSSCGGGCSS